MPLSGKELLEGLTAWVQARGAVGLPLVSALTGGYEAWFQADFGGYLNLALTGSVAREQPVYQNQNERVDLLINPTSGVEDQILVEVKTQRINQLAIGLISEIQNDLNKLAENRNSLYTENDAYMVVITLDLPGSESVLQWAPDNGTTRIFNKLQVNIDPLGIYWAYSSTEGQWEAQKK
ncbi:hypothetical protein [Bradyrhizobium sp. USDA 4353]